MRSKRRRTDDGDEAVQDDHRGALIEAVGSEGEEDDGEEGKGVDGPVREDKLLAPNHHVGRGRMKKRRKSVGRKVRTP